MLLFEILLNNDYDAYWLKICHFLPLTDSISEAENAEIRGRLGSMVIPNVRGVPKENWFYNMLKIYKKLHFWSILWLLVVAGEPLYMAEVYNAVKDEKGGLQNQSSHSGLKGIRK